LDLQRREALRELHQFSARQLHVRLKGSNNDGVWNEEGIAVKITITPPPWRTWWAYTIYVLAIGSLLYGIRRYELNRMRLKDRLRLEQIEAEKLKELDHVKSRFFANISHEFRTPLTLILGPLEGLLQNTVSVKLKEQYEIMQRNGRRLLQLINQLLDLAKLEAGSMTLRAKPEEKKRFINEAKAASALDHPNICSIHEINETEDGQMFIDDVFDFKSSS
jgi:signal transduction histidine kinase